MSAAPSCPGDRSSVAVLAAESQGRVRLQRLRTAYGWGRPTYASGRECLATIDGDAVRLDCLVVDAHMPEMNGFELHRYLVARGVRIPTIVFTADDAPNLSADYFAVGVVAFL